jgi:hypothetical protein
MFAGGILASKSASPLVRQGLKPLAKSSSRLKPTGKNESFFKPFQKSYNIKPVGIVIIHLSLFFASDFSAFSAFSAV